MTVRQLAQYLGVEPVRVCFILTVLEHPPIFGFEMDDEIPSGGYELAVARQLLEEARHVD